MDQSDRRMKVSSCNVRESFRRIRKLKTPLNLHSNWIPIRQLYLAVWLTESRLENEENVGFWQNPDKSADFVKSPDFLNSRRLDSSRHSHSSPFASICLELASNTALCYTNRSRELGKGRIGMLPFSRAIAIAVHRIPFKLMLVASLLGSYPPVSCAMASVCTVRAAFPISSVRLNR
jgi:hypothetical protein